MITIDYIIDIFENQECKPDVYIIANAQDYTNKISEYSIKHASNNEFFSASEFGEIASALFSIGCYVSIFYTEIEFIKFILKNNSRLDYENLLVLNLSRDGILEGKKSLIPAFCDMMNIRYSGSNPFVVSLCRNKFIWSSVLDNHNIKVPNFFQLKEGEKIGNYEINKGINIIKKNIYESASIGLTSNSIEQISDINSKFIVENDNMLIQEFIDGIEVEVPFFKFGKEYMLCTPVQILFSNDESYLTSECSNEYNYKFSFLENNCLVKKIQNDTQKIAKLLGINGYGRVDFRINSKGEYFVIDIATMPYIINHSSFSFWFKEKKYNYNDLYKVLLMTIKYKYLS
ncbi:ATP-grasp domain-containing protein [Clostridium perfringens]|nr:ATP-grasp domain-containing protein [Clostridium perfringens]